jgi:nucleoside phosphorylase
VTAGRLTAPGLLAHVFLRAGNQETLGAQSCLRTVWGNVVRRFGLDDAVPGLDVTSRLPARYAVPSAGFSLLAAAERREASVWQASAWADHGTVGLTAMMAPARELDGAAVWHELEQAWNTAAAPLDRELLLGESRIFFALASTALASTPLASTVLASAGGPAAELVRAAAPESSGAGWWRHWDAIPLESPGGGADQLQLWETGPDLSDARTTRRLIAVAPVACEREADRFLWTTGDSTPSPLTRHLLHAARLRYQVRVFDDGQLPRDLRGELGALVDGVSARLDPAREPGGRDRLAVQLWQTHGAAIALRRRLDAMRHAVGAIEENMRLALNGPAPDRAGGPVTEDRQLATWFGQRLDDEIALLDAAVGDAQSARSFLAEEVPTRTLLRSLDGPVRSLPGGLADVQPLRVRPQHPRAIVFTALGVEYSAIRDHLTGPVRRLEEHGTVYEVGTLGGGRGLWDIALAETGPGSTAAGVQLDRAVRVFAPQVALFLGIAGGRKDVNLGDVVVADVVYDYESGKATLDGFEPRMRTHHPAHRLLQWARLVARENQWQRRIRPACPPLPPSSFVKPIVTGGKVITHDQAETALLVDRYAGDALAVETEGHGFLEAAYVNTEVDAIVIRGISDLLIGKDKKNDDYWQPVASRHAAAFAVELLDSIGSG